MFIVVNNFIPKDNNLLGMGGKSVKVSCIPVGDYEPAKCDSYKQVYDDECNFIYPQIPENIEKGNLYWKNKTLCGTEKIKDGYFSLIRAYKEHIIPDMEKMAREESGGGIYDVTFIEKEDGEECHNNLE